MIDLFKYKKHSSFLMTPNYCFTDGCLIGNSECFAYSLKITIGRDIQANGNVTTPLLQFCFLI